MSTSTSTSTVDTLAITPVVTSTNTDVVAVENAKPKAKNNRHSLVIPKKVKREPRKGGAKAFRSRPGRNALREIQFYQNSTTTLLRRGPYRRMLNDRKQKTAAYNGNPQQYSETAKQMIQEYTELALVRVFALAYRLCKNAGRKTMKPQDFIEAERITSGL